MLNGRKFAILEFDLCRQSLSAIEVLANVVDMDVWIRNKCQFLIAPADAGGLNFLVLTLFSTQLWKSKANRDSVAIWMLGSSIDLNELLSLRAGADTRRPDILGLAEDNNVMFIGTDVGVFVVHIDSVKFKKISQNIHSRRHNHAFTSFYIAGHIAEMTHKINTINPAGSTERTISSVIRPERVARGIGGHPKSASHQIHMIAQSLEEGSRSSFDVHASEGDMDHIVLSNAGNDCEKLTPHTSELEAGTRVEGVQGADSERSRSKKPAASGNLGNSIMSPTQGAMEIKSIVVKTVESYMECKKKQYIPHREFSIAKCIAAMRDMVDVSNEEKVLACDLFGDDVNREIFLSLDVTLCTMWLKKQLTKVC